MRHVERPNLSAFHIIDIQSLAVHRDVEIALFVVCHAVDARTGKVQFLLCLARGGVVAVQCVSVAQPVVAPVVFVYEACAHGRLRVRHYLARRVEPVDTAVLHRTPCDAVLALRYGRDTTAYDVVLLREAPRVEGFLALAELVESLFVATYPQVVVLVLDDVVDEGGAEVHLAAEATRWFHLAFAVSYQEGTVLRGAEVEVSPVVEGGVVDGGTATVYAEVVARIRYAVGAVVVIDDAVHADDEQNVLAPLEEGYWCAARRMEVLLAYPLAVFACMAEAGECGQVTALPQLLAVVYINMCKEDVRILDR